MEFDVVERGFGEKRKYYFKGSDGKIYGEGYDYAYNFHEGFAAVKKGGKWYFVDKDFNPHGEVYDDANDFSEGFAVVRKGYEYFFVDSKDFKLHGQGYDVARGFSEGFARVRRGYTCYFVDKDFNHYGEYDTVWDLNGGFAVVEKDGHRYQINRYFEKVPGSDQILTEDDYIESIENDDTMLRIPAIPAFFFSKSFVKKLKGVVYKHFNEEIKKFDGSKDTTDSLAKMMEAINKIICYKQALYKQALRKQKLYNYGGDDKVAKKARKNALKEHLNELFLKDDDDGKAE